MLPTPRFPHTESHSMELQTTEQLQPGDFTHNDAQDIIQKAYEVVSRLYADTPDLYNMLSDQLREGYDECNRPDTDPMQLLHNQMRRERQILDAYNKHRLGKALHSDGISVANPTGSTQYREEENIPEQLKWFPVRNEITKRGFNVIAVPIFQLSGTIEYNQQFSARQTRKVVSSFESPERIPTPPVAKKRGRGAANYNKLADSPSAQLAFPHGNITLAEITAFLPQSLRSWDVIDRILFNGALSTTLAGMINHFRIMPNGPIENNSVYRMMKVAMNKRALEDPVYRNWSVTAHQNLEMPYGFDPESVSVTGFRTPAKFKNRETGNASREPVPAILFRDLMSGVRIMPSGYDALDLTRCVQYCVDHPNEDWYYPQDFNELVNQLPQDPHFADYPAGPAPVHPNHHDTRIVERYTSAQKLDGANRTFQRQRDRHGRLVIERRPEDGHKATINIKPPNDQDISDDYDALDQQGMKRKRKSSDNEGDRSDARARKKLRAKRPTRSNASRRVTASPPRPRNEAVIDDTDSDSNAGLYEGPKTRKTRVVPTRSSRRSQRFQGSYNLNAALDVDGEDE